MQRRLTLALPLLLCACAGIPVNLNEYDGADAGHAVVAIAAAADTHYFQYVLRLRRVGTEGDITQRFVYAQGNLLLAQQPDWTDSSGSGVVQSLKLAPGEYEIYNFNVTDVNARYRTEYSSRQPVAIRFTVRSGQTTYVGHYRAHKQTLRTRAGAIEADGARFVVIDRQAQDLALLLRRNPNAAPAPVVNATPDPARLGNPYFVRSL
jgi:hypothetical protein